VSNERVLRYISVFERASDGRASDPCPFRARGQIDAIYRTPGKELARGRERSKEWPLLQTL